MPVRCLYACCLTRLACLFLGFAAAKRVLIVPGYGLAVANAQYSIADLVRGLRQKGIEIK